MVIKLPVFAFEQPGVATRLWIQAAYGRGLPQEQIRLASFLQRVGDGAGHDGEIERVLQEHLRALVRSSLDTTSFVVYFQHDERGLHLHCGNPTMGYTTRLTCLRVSEDSLLYALVMILSEDVALVVDGVLACVADLKPHVEWLGVSSVAQLTVDCPPRENRPIDRWADKPNELA